MQKSAGHGRGYILALILVWAVTVVLRLGGLPFTGPDEPRYARIAEEMLAEGRWVTPVLEGKPWLEKPPLYYWLTIPWFALAGISETAARTGPALCALLTALAIFFLGSRIRSPGTGFLAACILLTCIGIPAFGRNATTDMPFTACMTVSLALLAARAGSETPAWHPILAYAFLGMAVLAKGPVAFILAAGILVVFWTLDDRGGALRRLAVPQGTVIALAVAVPWFILVFDQNGYSFIATFLINHNLARYVSDIHHHTQPVYYFIPVLLGLLFPWSGWLAALWPGSPVKRLKAWRDWDPALLFLLCWFAVPFVFFSLSRAKLAGYILPAIPPLALLLAARLRDGFDKAGPNRRLAVSAWIQIVLSAGVAAAFPIVWRQRYGGEWTDGIPLAAATLLPAVAALWMALKGKWRIAVGATALQGLLLIFALTTQSGFPFLARYHSTRDISRMALAARQAAEPIVTYRFFHHTFFYYTGYEGGQPLADKDELRRFAGEHPRFLVVTEAKREEEIRETGLQAEAKGRQGKLVLLEIMQTR